MAGKYNKRRSSRSKRKKANHKSFWKGFWSARNGFVPGKKKKKSKKNRKKWGSKKSKMFSLASNLVKPKYSTVEQIATDYSLHCRRKFGLSDAETKDFYNDVMKAAKKGDNPGFWNDLLRMYDYDSGIYMIERIERK